MMWNKENLRVQLPLIFFVSLSALTPSIHNEEKGIFALFLLLFTPLSFGIYYFWGFKLVPVGERILFPFILWPLGLAISYCIGAVLLKNLFNLFFEEDGNGRVTHDYAFLANLSINILTTVSLLTLLRFCYFMFSKS